MRRMKIKTGIFGGSFNPIHIGHLALANYLCEFEGLEELWFLVSPQNPIKKQEILWDDQKRLQLVEAAIVDYPKFRASDFEFSLPRPSYTFYTLSKLKETYPLHSFILIIGSDNWIYFDKWKEANRILAENEVWIYPRPGFPVNGDSLPVNIRLINAPLLEISSTFIRNALSERKDIRYFLHPNSCKILMEE